VRPTDDPDVWWSSKGSLLSDGLKTETRHDCVIANLRGRRLPEMSVDRREVRTHDEAFIDAAMARSWEQLVGWDALGIRAVWALEKASPQSARRLVEALPKDARVWDHNRRRKIPLHAVGCFFSDEDVLRDVEFYGHELSRIGFVTAWRAS